MAGDIEHWRDAYQIELNVCKLAALERGDDVALGRGASLCNVLENGPPEEIIREFILHRNCDPAEVALLIAAGAEREWHAGSITTEIVLMIARAAEMEGLTNAA